MLDGSKIAIPGEYKKMKEIYKSLKKKKHGPCFECGEKMKITDKKTYLALRCTICNFEADLRLETYQQLKKGGFNA